MNKAELINAMASESGLSKADSKRALGAFISSVGKAMQNGEKVSLIGFGSFTVLEREERTGINPSTQKPMVIPAKKVVKFKPGNELILK